MTRIQNAVFPLRTEHYPLFVALLGSAVVATTIAAREPFAWENAAPESQGMSSSRLDAWRESLAQRQTRALLVIRSDKIVYEWYADGQSADTKQGTASLAKALVGGMSLALALQDGLLSLDDPAAKYLTAWRDDPVRSKITIRHLGSHTSGLDDAHNRAEQARGVNQMKYSGWTGDFWRWREQEPLDAAYRLSRDVAPVLFPPGTDFQYSNPGLALLGYCVTASLRRSPHPDLRTLLRERLMRPLGVRDQDWSCGYGVTAQCDGLPLVANWGGGSYTPRAAARVGRLVLRKGDWDGERLLSAEVVRQVTGDAGWPGHCGMGWWTNAGRRYAEVPEDAVWGAGAGQQILLVVPSLNLICVRNGGDLFGRLEKQDRLGELLFQPLIETIVDRTRATKSG